MSYNVSGFRVMEKKDFMIPLEAMLRNPTMVVQLELGDRVRVTGDSEMFEIKGKIVGDCVAVTKIYEGGEGSGNNFDVLEALLAKSKGLLRVLVVWEGGDTIEICTWQDGVLTRNNLADSGGAEEDEE